jgi:hypothetical protein
MGESHATASCENQVTFLKATLSTAEETFVVDVLLGMVAMMLTQRSPSQSLCPLLTFITYNLDLEWESASAGFKSDNDQFFRRSNRYLSTVKAVCILFFILQKSPRVPLLIESLADIFDNGTSSWILCCLVNSYDDSVRGLGIKCLAAYLQSDQPIIDNIVITNGAMTVHPRKKIHKTMKLGLEVIHSANTMLSSVFSGRTNIKVIYKLLWHLLKCHRERLGSASNAALMYLIMHDGSTAFTLITLSDIIVPNSSNLGGFCLNMDKLVNQSSMVDSRQSIRNTYGVSTVLRLLKFLSNDHKERWLFDLLAFLLASPKSVDVLLSCDDWQPVLFHLVAEVLEEIHGGDSYRATDDTANRKSATNVLSGKAAVNTETLSKPSVRTRFDLSLKLYSTLLGHCVRQGDEKAFNAVEMAGSLQRTDANGPEIFSILLSHLLADLIEKGTLASVEMTYSNHDATNAGRNRALKQSARLVTLSILSNGVEGLDLTSAVKQWRCLRYLTALTVAVVTDSG